MLLWRNTRVTTLRLELSRTDWPPLSKITQKGRTAALNRCERVPENTAASLGDFSQEQRREEKLTTGSEVKPGRLGLVLGWVNIFKLKPLCSSYYFLNSNLFIASIILLLVPKHQKRMNVLNVILSKTRGGSWCGAVSPGPANVGDFLFWFQSSLVFLLLKLQIE